MTARPAPCCPPKTGNNSTTGFTLLEVMISLAIIGIAFTAMLSSQARNVTLATETKFQTTAPLLAQDIMARFMAEPRTNGGMDRGDWGSDFPDYRWQVQSAPANLGLGTNLQGLFQVDVTVSWQEQERYTYRQRGYLFHTPSGQ